MTDGTHMQNIVDRTQTVTLTNDCTDSSGSQGATVAVRLKLQKPKEKKVNWEEGTVDNEHLNRKKSKCCCIYKKPRQHLDSSSSEDDEMDCDDCRGHVEKKKRATNHDEATAHAIADSMMVP